VKILDFGLARVRPPVTPNAQEAIPTETGAGIVMGTVGYMSPEQVRGDRTDVPSDVFSFGCVLYEMLAGRRAFARDTAAQTMTAILEADPPDLAVSGIQIPAELKRLVSHCLEKNPRQRFQSAQDLAFALKAIPESDSTPRDTRKPVKRAWLAAAALAVVLAAA